MEELGEEGYAVGKLDVDQNMELAQQFRVMSIPTLIIFKNGAEAHRLVGLTDKKEELKRNFWTSKNDEDITCSM